jgi:hypothetical protein
MAADPRRFQAAYAYGEALHAVLRTRGIDPRWILLLDFIFPI